MKKRTLLVVAAVALVVVGVAIAQQPAPKVAPPSTETSPWRPPAKPAEKQPAPTLIPNGLALTPIESKPDDMSAEQLLEKVKAIRAQKADLEKTEQALMKVLTKKTDKLKEEVDALNGVTTPLPPLPGGPRLPVVPEGRPKYIPYMP